MSLTWLSNTNIKKPKHPKPNGKRRKEPSPAKRERIHAVQSHCRASLHRLTALHPTAPWWFSRIVQSGYASPLSSSNHLSSLIQRRPKPQAPSLHHWPILAFVFLFRHGFRRLCFCFRVDFGLCLCFGISFGVCVCVSAWISSWVLGFVCISSLCFGLGFCWLFLIYWFQFGLLIFLLFFLVFLIWVLLIFLLIFSGFSALFFFFLVLLHWFLMGFGHSGGIAVVQWFPDWTVRWNRVFLCLYLKVMWVTCAYSVSV